MRDCSALLKLAQYLFVSLSYLFRDRNLCLKLNLSNGEKEQSEKDLLTIKTRNRCITATLLLLLWAGHNLIQLLILKFLHRNSPDCYDIGGSQILNSLKISKRTYYNVNFLKSFISSFKHEIYLLCYLIGHSYNITSFVRLNHNNSKCLNPLKPWSVVFMIILALECIKLN